MTISEVTISALIFAISAQTSLRGWSASQAQALNAVQRDHQLQAIERRLLISQRLLAVGMPVDRRCRFQRAAALAVLAQRPVAPELIEQLEWRPDGQGLWLSLQTGPEGDPLQRRRLFTPAGLGLCRQEVA